MKPGAESSDIDCKTREARASEREASEFQRSVLGSRDIDGQTERSK
jgi:hypothetical protein